MPVHFPSESGSSAETPHGRSNVRTPDSVRLGVLFPRCEIPVSIRASQIWPRGFNSAFASRSLQTATRVANFDSEVPALNRRELGANPRQPTISASVVKFIIILRFERRVCRWESCRMHQFTGMWFNPNSRGSRLRIWQPWGCKSLHAHHFAATGFSGNSRPRRLKTPRLPSASPGSPTSLRSSGFDSASRRVVHREEQTDSAQTRTALGVQVSPRGPIWNVHRSSAPGTVC